MTSSNHAVCIESTEQLLLRHVELNASNSQSSPIPRINASTQICVQEDQLDDAESNSSSSSINDQLSILAEDEYDDDDIVFTPHPPTTSNGVLTSAPTYMMEESKMIHPNDNNINNTKNLEAEPFSSQLQQSPPKVNAPQPHEEPSTTLHLHHGGTTPSSLLLQPPHYFIV
ncbi:hypothetical protein C9374_008932 [Naegleria lovaniensis]|uniref:Uncharacterized protein n=1 Tax=Naegleria lovaniensis TaxID=51637 RepID=A0AA88KEW9_NAELO|nr:uncharacterized protein C9374_008932 [Naegleria lovaniensis]KAG2377847.1 hypothetical protein C9374_008932 [Naegleria lovaniensis]